MDSEIDNAKRMVEQMKEATPTPRVKVEEKAPGSIPPPILPPLPHKVYFII